ncbi:TnsA-like heteromeric transposase endonuclease subunit [Streptomyces sp. NPDC060187]|uniref:TnsA-like heteromeric transposase endonuclease subunit n=1 Tax=Streptomyces sp. NPDC060187 TaxID=3347067 RepID=UPI00364C9D3E
MEVAFTALSGEGVQLPFEQAVGSVRFEELAPVSAFPVRPHGWGAPGWWWSATTRGHVAHGSAAMRLQLMELDRDPQVVGLSARPARFLWRRAGDGQVGTWIPQVFARYADGTALFADCPSRTGPAVGRALQGQLVLESVCAFQGWVYRRLVPPGAVRAANLRWLAGYRHPRHRGPEAVQAAVRAAFAVARPLMEGAARAGDPLQVLPVVYHALWAGKLAASLEVPLDGHTLVRAGPDAGGGSSDSGVRAARPAGPATGTGDRAGGGVEPGVGVGGFV